jgi:hypothetical protein
MKINSFRTVALLITMAISMNAAVAQDPGDPSADDPAAPLDGGITLLLAAGAAMGGRKLYRSARDKDL